MTSPKYAANVPGQGRWYTLPTGERFPSVTNVLGLAVAKPALAGWSAKETEIAARQAMPSYVARSRKRSCGALTADGGANSRIKAADRCGSCIDCLSLQVRRAANESRDRAANLGTRVHHQAEAEVLGRPVAEDPEAAPFVRQAIRFFDDFGVDMARDVEATEATVINRTHGYAGTGDLWLRLTIGGTRRLILLDYKSSSTRAANSVYPEYAMQLAALANAETLLLDNGEEVEPPGPVEGAAILNLRAGDYALMPYTADDLTAAFNGFLGALGTANYLLSQHGVKREPLAAPAVSTRKAS